MSIEPSQNNPQQPGAAGCTERQLEKLTEAISRSQHNYRELIDNLDQALFTLSLDGVVRVANLRLSEILRVSFQNLIGHSLYDFIESPAASDAQRALPEFLRKGTWAGALPIRLRGESEIRYFSCWLQTVIENGQPAHITGWARDITAQHESEIRFSELFESLREGIVFVTLEGQLLDANPALVRMLGYDSKEELKTINFRDMYDNPAVREKILRDLEEHGAVHGREVVFRRKDGKRIYCLTSGFAIRDASGRAVRLQGTVVDITERIEIEKRLHQEQEFVSRLVTSFPDVIAVLDREARYTYISGRIRDVVGKSPQEFLGTKLGSRCNDEDRQKLEQMFDQVMSGKETRVQVEFRAPHRDGSSRVLLATASPLFDEKGKITGVVTSARDVTESKQVEQEFAQKERFAAMGQMMVGAAHELNNPLTAILGISDLLRDRVTDETTRRQVDVILQQARRAAAIVLNLLAFSRNSTRKYSKLRLEEIVRDALQLQQAVFQQKNITAQFEAASDLPGVEGDRKLLTQVFLNIFENAQQSISAVRGSGELRVSLSRAGESIRATISDNGGGIAPESVAKIFDPFFTTKRPGGGSGLGLSICLAVIKEHGGSIEVESIQGEGAAFSVLLPIAAEDRGASESRATPESATGPARESSASGPEALRGRSVLIVDDEESILEIMKEGLSARGMAVNAVKSSEEALSHFAAKDFEIVVCDFNLPGMNGDQLFEKVRSQRNGTSPYFVFMTGEMVDSEVMMCYREKGAAILQKPFHISALLSLLSESAIPASPKSVE